MGVDYSATFGIGIKIESSDIERIYKEQTGEGDFDSELSTTEMIDEINLPEGIEYGEAGSRMYGGKGYWFLFIKEPFENGTGGVEEKIKRFEKQLSELGITEYKIDVVGGVHVW